MLDEELTKYVPLHGDRLRIRKFLRDRETSKKRGRRSTLFQVLREKIESRESSGSTDGEGSSKERDMRESNRRFGNKNAEKERTRIELGWIHKCGSKSVQIRSKKGGEDTKIDSKQRRNKKRSVRYGENAILSKWTVV